MDNELMLTGSEPSQEGIDVSPIHNTKWVSWFKRKRHQCGIGSGMTNME